MWWFAFGWLTRVWLIWIVRWLILIWFRLCDRFGCFYVLLYWFELFTSWFVVSVWCLCWILHCLGWTWIRLLPVELLWFWISVGCLSDWFLMCFGYYGLSVCFVFASFTVNFGFGLGFHLLLLDFWVTCYSLFFWVGVCITFWFCAFANCCVVLVGLFMWCYSWFYLAFWGWCDVGFLDLNFLG